MPSEFNPSEFLSSTDGNPKPSIDFTETVPLPNQGGMSIVQKTKILGKWHLIKRLKPEYSKHPVYITNFEKEFDIAYHLEHPHIVRYLNKGFDAEGIYIIMEYVDGQSLRTILNQDGILKNNKRFEKIFLQLLDALSYLHKHQVYHLDLKPENIMLTNKGDNIKLLDFGLSGMDSYLSMDSGTLKYASPEQKLNSETADGRSDIYSFGLLLLELLQGDTDKKNINQISGVYKNVIAKCVMEIPAERFQSAEEIIEFIHTNKKRNNIIQYFIVVALIGFSVVIYSVIRLEKNTTVVSNNHAELPIKPIIQPIIAPPQKQLVNDEKTIPVTLKHNKKATEHLPDEKVMQTKVNLLMATYYDSIFSKSDSVKCIQIGENLYAHFKAKVEQFDKAPSQRSRKLVLMDIQDTCTRENQKQWREFSKKFSLGSTKYSRAERIYSNVERESSDKILKMVFPNNK